MKAEVNGEDARHFEDRRRVLLGRGSPAALAQQDDIEVHKVLGKIGLRLDEYAVRFTPSRDGTLSLQLGQFATIVGNWVARH